MYDINTNDHLHVSNTGFQFMICKKCQIIHA